MQDSSDPKLIKVRRRTLIDLSELLVGLAVRGDDVLNLCAG